MSLKTDDRIGAGRQVVHAGDDDAARVILQQLGMQAFLEVAIQVTHLAGKAAREEVAHVRLVRGEVERGHAEALKPELGAPESDACGKRVEVWRVARLPPVGTPQEV